MSYYLPDSLQQKVDAMNRSSVRPRAFTQYVSPWVDGRRTKTIIDRTDSTFWTVESEAGNPRSVSTEPLKVTAEQLAGIEKFLVASGCDRFDHS